MNNRDCWKPLKRISFYLERRIIFNLSFIQIYRTDIFQTRTSAPHSRYRYFPYILAMIGISIIRDKTK